MRGEVEKSTRCWHVAAALGLATVLTGAAGAKEREQGKSDARQRERLEQTQRHEGQTVLNLADAAMKGGRVPSDFQIRWHNDFLKAQQGTFVPFVLTVDSSKLTSPTVLVYIRAALRSAINHSVREATRTKRNDNRKDRGAEIAYPVDAIFPAELKAEAGQVARVTRGFSVPPGEYDVYVVMRERVDPAAPLAQPKAAVLKQAISVPNFWSDELTTSSVILADHLTMLSEPITAEQLVERPYVIGQNDITPATDGKFRKDEELIVVFLVYNPTVTPDRKFDVQVEYHFFRRAGQRNKSDAAAAAPHPPEREGEKYFNHTDPQRFNATVMGAQFDPNAGHPVMAGQGVPLAGFEPGDYRLAIKVTDLLSGKSIERDVSFTVGS